MSENESLPVQDDIPADNNGQTEAQLLDAVLKNSPIMNEIDPLPTEEIPEVDPAETVEEDPESTEEVVSEDVEEGSEELVEEATGEDAAAAATQETEVFTSDDLDLDAKVMVKVDGEEQEVSFGDLLKGYQTDAHLSKQGRELGEARKALDSERAEKLEQLDNITSASTAMLMQGEQGLAKQYGELEKQIEEARKNDDDYEVSKLKDKREQVQKSYWQARNRREGLIKAVEQQKQEVVEKQWKEQLDNFNKEIPTMIPDFNEKVANDIRQFAIDEGIKSEILDQITDPAIVKFVDDYRRLKQGVSKGAAKRKTAPVRKAIPTKKAAPQQKKQADREAMVKARAFKEDATQDQQMDFLRQYASKSLNL